MAVIGTGSGGYAMVNPIQGNPIGDALSNVENSAFRYRAEKTQQDQIKAQQARQLQEDRRRDMDDAYKFSKDNPFVATGTGLDAVNRQSYMNAKDTAAKAYGEYLKTGDAKQRAIYENAVSSVNNISEFPKQINALKEDWVKNAANYNPESLKRKAAFLDQIASGQIVQTNDSNGNPKYTVFDRDEDGNINKLSHKDITGDQLLKLLAPEKAFNIDGKEGFIDLFNKNIGKERKIIEGKGLNAVEKTYNPGAEELAKLMANDAVNDRSKMYETLQRMGLDPEDNNNYTDEKVKDAASNYLEKMLMVTAPTTVSQKPDTSLDMLNLARTKEANDERQRAITNARESRKEAKEDDTATTWGQVQTIKDGDRNRNTGIKVNLGDKVIQVVSPGKKDKTGASQATKAIAVHKDGSISVAIDKNVGTDPMTFEPKIKTISYNTKTTEGKGNVERALIGLETNEGVKIKNLKQAKEFIKNYAGVSGQQKEPVTKLSETQEKAINTAMKANPGYSREEIMSALNLK